MFPNFSDGVWKAFPNCASLSLIVPKCRQLESGLRPISSTASFDWGKLERASSNRQLHLQAVVQQAEVLSLQPWSTIRSPRFSTHHRLIVRPWLAPFVACAAALAVPRFTGRKAWSCLLQFKLHFRHRHRQRVMLSTHAILCTGIIHVPALRV
jgi:hypothetical protein